MKKKLIAMVVAAGAMLGARAEPIGSCMNRAISIGVGGSTEVTLVNEYDSEYGEYLNNGCCFYKVTLTKGTAYTIWISGGQTSSMGMSVDTDWDDVNQPLASFFTSPIRMTQSRLHTSILTTGVRMIQSPQLTTSASGARLEARVRFLRHLAFVPLVSLARWRHQFG